MKPQFIFPLFVGPFKLIEKHRGGVMWVGVASLGQELHSCRMSLPLYYILLIVVIPSRGCGVSYLNKLLVVNSVIVLNLSFLLYFSQNMSLIY